MKDDVELFGEVFVEGKEEAQDWKMWFGGKCGKRFLDAIQRVRMQAIEDTLSSADPTDPMRSEFARGRWQLAGEIQMFHDKIVDFDETTTQNA